MPGRPRLLCCVAVTRLSLRGQTGWTEAATCSFDAAGWRGRVGGAEEEGKFDDELRSSTVPGSGERCGITEVTSKPRDALSHRHQVDSRNRPAVIHCLKYLAVSL